MSLSDPHAHEIIIVKHRNDDDEGGHHGGVWKIAFADFMTAMMCFFLVMWLINAANEETKVAVASYFNPIKLVDRNSSRRGLDDVGAGPQSHEETSESDSTATKQEAKSSGPSSSGVANEKNAKDGEKKEIASDEHLFTDPYAVLAEIAAESGEKQNISSKGDGGAQNAGPATGASGGESYRDPFAPDFWSKQIEPSEIMEDDPFNQPPKLEVRPPEPLGEVQDQDLAEEDAFTRAADAMQAIDDALDEDAGELLGSGIGESLDDGKSDQTQPGGNARTEGDKGKDGIAAKVAAGGKEGDKESAGKTGEQAAGEAKTGEKPTGDDKATGGKVETAEAKPEPAPAKPQPSPEAIRAAEEIKQEIAKAFGASERIFEGIAVTPTERGVVVSLTDQLNYGMFEIGSAVPRRDLVLAMEKIGKILAERGGMLHIGGHTDGRPYKGEKYDNWRLSTARAHSAYYMLVRAGIAEKRIVEVAGYADRKLKVTDDPNSALNRRIELLLETDG